MPDRLSYEDSCRALQLQGILKKNKFPPLPVRSPRYDDEEPLGVSFFRMLVDDAGRMIELSNEQRQTIDWQTHDGKVPDGV